MEDTQRIYTTLKQVFGYDEFRPGQEELVTALLDGRDALGVMPTGAGKSLCFQLPVALTLLGRVGIVTSAGLAKARRFAIFGVFVVAGILTPPDALSQFALAVPVLALYEISIWLVRASEKKRAQPDQGTTSKG